MHVSMCIGLLVFYLILVNRFAWDVPPHPFLCIRVVEMHGQSSIEFEERGSEFWVMVRRWERSTLRRVCVTVLSRFSASTTLEAIILEKVLVAAGPNASVVSLNGDPHVLAEGFGSYLGSSYHAKLVEYPTFNLSLMKRGLQRTCASVFGSLSWRLQPYVACGHLPFLTATWFELECRRP